MERFVKGDVVVVPFPFSDLTNSKKRPALVINNLDGDDVILCQITSKPIYDKYSLSISNEDFVAGNLDKESNIRPNRLFTADKNIILYKIGSLNKLKIETIINKIVEIIKK